jgi:coatomer subunit epsilon
LDKANQASYIFEELIEKYGATSFLLNGQAACKLGCGQYMEAEPLLLQALEKSPNDKNTLILHAVCMRYLNKPVEQINRKLKQARSLPGHHTWLTDYDHHEQLFDTAAKRYKK